MILALLSCYKDNLSTFVFSLIRAIGMIILGFGIVQLGLSLKSHDPSQRANGFLTVIVAPSSNNNLVSLCEPFT